MANTQDQEMAQWAVSALNNVQIVGSQATNIIAVMQFLTEISSGKLLVVDAESYNTMLAAATDKVVSLDETGGSTG